MSAGPAIVNLFFATHLVHMSNQFAVGIFGPKKSSNRMTVVGTPALDCARI